MTDEADLQAIQAQVDEAATRYGWRRASVREFTIPAGVYDGEVLEHDQRTVALDVHGPGEDQFRVNCLPVGEGTDAAAVASRLLWPFEIAETDQC